jgi:WD40 repeat protein/DNA-binding SARP family transcriptional activator
MRFGVLGPLEARAGGELLTIKGVKERRLLGCLLSRANSVLPVGDIIEALWGADPPRSAAKSVQVYVVRVRKMLGGAAGENALISRLGRGYVLRVARDQVDALEFADLVARAREAAAAGAHGVAATVLRDALGLWRGAAYADFQDTWFGVTEAVRLEEMRLAALEARIDADLALGRHAEVTAEIEAVVRECPLRERFWAQLMVALYRSGRQSDALLAFRRARDCLVEEIGVEPGPELQALEAAVLAHDPGLAVAGAAAAAPPELPAELRRADPLFVAREDAMSCLRGLWADAERGRGGLVLVTGPAGIGRTRLAAELAHHAHARGAVVHLRSGPARAGDGPSQPGSIVEAAAGRPVLLILDDVDRPGPETVALLEAPAAEVPRLSLLVVATYDPACADSRLHAVELRAGHGHRLALPRLEAADAALIVRRCLGAEAEPGVVGRIVAQAQGLPGRLHELAAAWMEEDAAQRVAAAVEQAPAARRALSAVRATVRDGVLDLHRVRQGRPAHTGPQAGDGQALCPYKGLARFEKEDAAIFHGREALVAALVARLADTPLVAVTGPSGAGKSSLVRAGLLPALAAGVLPGSGRWQQCVLTPGTAPRGGLPQLPEAAQAPATVMVVDQFEELFTTCRDEAERASFVASLVGLLEREPAPVRMILVVRADYLGPCATYPELASRIGDGTVLVGPMRDDEVRRAVEGPARYAGLDVEQDLLDAVVADVRGRPGGLPLLSTALLDTWQRRRGRTLTHAGYLAAGGVSGALARLAESAYARLAPAGQQAARRILVRLAETGEAGLPVRRRVPLEEVVPQGDEAARAALDVLVARRLLTAGDGNVEVAHEALLSHWPRLARWLEEDAQGRALRHHLAPAARDWTLSGRPDAELYRGARLASALDWAAGHTGDLNPAEAEFLEASRAAADRELREQRERADREAHARLREGRARRRLRVVLACVFALLVFSAAAGAVALQQRGQARAAQRSAEARRLGALALSEPDLDRSLLLAAAAVRTDPSLATEGDLLSALLRSPHALALVRGNGRLQDLALSPDGRVLAVGDNDGTVILWDARTMSRISTPLHGGDWSGRVAFSPDSRQLAVLSETGSGPQVVIFDLTTRRAILRLPAGDTDEPGKPTWTRDGRIVAVGSGTGALIFYDAATGREKGQVNVPGASTSHAVDAYPAGGKILAIAEDTRDAVLVDPKTAHIIRRILLPVPASGAGVSRDGRTVAAGDVRGDVVIDDVKTGRVLQRNRAHASLVTNLVFSPDGRTVASLSTDEKAIVWDVKTGKPRLTLAGHTGYILGGAFAPDGQTLYTDGLDSSVIAWDLAGGRSFGTTRPNVDRGPFSVATLGFPYVGWSADRRRAVIGFQTGLVATMDVPAGRLTTPRRLLKDLQDLALSPDGRYAYLTSVDGLVRRWDTTTGRVDELSTVGDSIGKGVVSVSPNGRLLVVCDGSDIGYPVPCYFADARTLRRVGPRIDPGFTAGAAAFSPDGRLVALGDYAGPGVTVLQVRNGKVSWANRSLSQVQVLGFSPLGRRLVAGTYDGGVATFDAASGRQLAGPIVAQAGPVLAASFAPGGQTILTSGTDGTIRLWEPAHLRPVGEPLHLLSAQGAFTAFTPDGREILGMDTTGRVTTWPATTAAWLSRACHIARRDFTPQERTLYSITPVSAKPCP